MHAVKSNVFGPGICLVFLALTPIVSIGADPGQFGTPKGDEGKRLNPVPGRISIEVDERANTGVVLVEFVEGTDRYRIAFDRFAGTAPYQDGGLATRVYE